MKNRIDHKQRGRLASSASLLVLAAALMAAKPCPAANAPSGYTFTPIAFLGDPAPGGGTFNNDFEPSALNNQGIRAFTADLIMPGQEGIFLDQRGTLTQLMRFGQPAPGGGVFAGGELGNIGLNDEGDVAFAFTLEPLQFFQLAPGAVGGVYRYSHITGDVRRVAASGTPVPGGGTFLGVGFDVSMNDAGTIAFCGVVGTADNPAVGVFLADAAGNVTSAAVPGMTAPNGGTWANLFTPNLNNHGDLVFIGNVAPASGLVASVYERSSVSGEITTIASLGNPLPGGGVLYEAGWPRINDAGDVLFGAALPPVAGFQPTGVYLYTGGTLLRVAGTGDAMPGGGHFILVPPLNSAWGFNNRSEVAFMAALDTTEVLSTGDEGLYIYSGGAIHLIARSGTVIPGVGTIYSLEMGNSAAPGLPPTPTGFPTGGAQLNDRGQTFFGCSLTDGRVVLLLATPIP